MGKTIRSMEEFEDLKKGGIYRYYGDLIVACSLEFVGSLCITGSLSIKAGWDIKAGGSIEAGGSIKAGGSIEAVGSIEAGGSCGIMAGFSITCKGLLKYGLKCFAGICTWREISEEEKTITCGKHKGGIIEYGILKETGLVENNKKKELLEKANELIKKADELKKTAEEL